MKKYILIAGVNGAGKSTLYQTLYSMHGLIRINTDEIVKESGDWRNTADQIRAGRLAVSKMKKCLEEGVSFNQETTLCGKSIIENIKKAQKKGYSIELHYVGVNSVEIAKERVHYRVAHGGHGISDHMIEKRYIESFINLREILSQCDLAVLYDNTVSFRRFAIFRRGVPARVSHDLPQWYQKLEEEIMGRKE